MKKIVIITTGGTIAMKKTETTLGVYQDFTQELLNHLHEMKGKVDISVHDFMNVGSDEIMFEHVLEIKDLINEYAKKGYLGAVVVHGTDTMEQTAYLLDLILDVKMGIAITGSQKLGTDAVYDGFQNIIDSVLCASDEDAHRQGVMLVFNGTIHFAREVTKTHTSSLDTFQSPLYGSAGIVGDDHRVYWHKFNNFREFYPVENITCRVEVIPQYISGDDLILNLLKDAGVDGIVIEGLGGGSIIPKTVLTACGYVKDNIPVIVTSMCQGRFLSNTYADDYCTKHLNEQGMIMGDNSTAIKARIKLVVLLSTTDKSVNIKEKFHKHFYKYMSN